MRDPGILGIQIRPIGTALFGTTQTYLGLEGLLEIRLEDSEFDVQVGSGVRSSSLSWITCPRVEGKYKYILKFRNTYAWR